MHYRESPCKRFCLQHGMAGMPHGIGYSAYKLLRHHAGTDRDNDAVSHHTHARSIRGSIHAYATSTSRFNPISTVENTSTTPMISD